MSYTVMAEVAQRRLARHIDAMCSAHSEAIRTAHLLALIGFFIESRLATSWAIQPTISVKHHVHVNVNLSAPIGCSKTGAPL